MSNFEFHSPYFLWLLLLLPLIAVWYYFFKDKTNATLTLSQTESFEKNNIWDKLRHILFIFRLLALGCLIIALARPRNVAVSKHTKSTRGIDIVMAIDVSASMLARDLLPNRLEALKKVAKQFVNKRPNDRIGVVVYAGESFTKTPITSDKRIITNSIESIDWGDLSGGTAIGMGLGAAVNRLKDSKAKSKVIILLTDGVNNTGFIDPKTATELAMSLGIKVYTIGLGTNGVAAFPYARDTSGKLLFRKAKVEIDEKLLKYIANQTDGKYFRATNNTKLKQIYNEIDKMEKTKIEELTYYNYSELYRIFVLLGGLFLLLEFVLRSLIFRSFV